LRKRSWINPKVVDRYRVIAATRKARPPAVQVVPRGHRFRVGGRFWYPLTWRDETPAKS
jgi:hypothetical protein